MQYDARTRITHRKFVPPTFKEIRHILNIATAHAAAPRLQMVTLDADDTIYEDGGTIRRDSQIVDIIVRLMRAGITVALVTAAGYPGRVERYEERLKGLLDAFNLAITMGAPPEFLGRFLVMGGECNYLHYIRVVDGRCRLVALPDHVWKDGRGVRWDHADIVALLDRAEACLRETAAALGLDINIIRKERAVGMIRVQKSRFAYEVLEEVAFAVQHALRDMRVPHCAFNGGNDVWVDVGNKALGIRALQALLDIEPAETIHVGDRFTRTGNDTMAREVCNGLWICNPKETIFVMRLVLRDLHIARHSRASRRERADVHAALAAAAAGKVGRDAKKDSPSRDVDKQASEHDDVEAAEAALARANQAAAAAAAAAADAAAAVVAAKSRVKAAAAAAASTQVPPPPEVVRRSSGTSARPAQRAARRRSRRRSGLSDEGMEMGIFGMDVARQTVADEEVARVLRSPARHRHRPGAPSPHVSGASGGAGADRRSPMTMPVLSLVPSLETMKRVDSSLSEGDAVDTEKLEQAFTDMTGGEGSDDEGTGGSGVRFAQ